MFPRNVLMLLKAFPVRLLLPGNVLTVLESWLTAWQSIRTVSENLRTDDLKC